jgi:hypothetical protein
MGSCFTSKCGQGFFKMPYGRAFSTTLNKRIAASILGPNTPGWELPFLKISFRL